MRGSVETHSIFADLLPPPTHGQLRRSRHGIVPDALLERPTAPGEGLLVGDHLDHLHDLKLIHYGSTRYRQAWLGPEGPARCARARAEQVHGGYVHRARALDAAHHPHIAEPDDRPIYSLRSFNPPRGAEGVVCYDP